MARVYLETSFFSAMVSDREDAASTYRRDVTREWWDTERSFHELLVSSEVTDELSVPTYRKRAEALALADTVPLVEVNEEMLGAARVLVREKVMPGPVSGDAIHVAAACISGCDFLLTWNIRHLANQNKVQHLARVCRRMSLFPPMLITPNLLWREEQ